MQPQGAASGGDGGVAGAGRGGAVDVVERRQVVRGPQLAGFGGPQFTVQPLEFLVRGAEFLACGVQVLACGVEFLACGVGLLLGAAAGLLVLGDAVGGGALRGGDALVGPLLDVGGPLVGRVGQGQCRVGPLLGLGHQAGGVRLRLPDSLGLAELDVLDALAEFVVELLQIRLGGQLLLERPGPLGVLAEQAQEGVQRGGGLVGEELPVPLVRGGGAAAGVAAGVAGR